MQFRTLPKDLTLQLLHGEVDEISDLAEQRIAAIKRTPCPRCGAALLPKVHGQAPFSARDPLPRLLATCECGFVLDQNSKLVLAVGSDAKVEDPLPIIKVDR